MAKIVLYASFMMTGLLVYTQYAAGQTTSGSSQTSPTQTTQANTQITQTNTQTTQTNTQTTTTESIRDMINRLVKEGIKKGIAEIQAAVANTATETTASQTTAQITVSQTTAPSTVSQTTASSKSSNNAATAAACPEGQFDQFRNTVTFTLDDKECQITVYLSKPPKGKKAKKAKKEKKDKKGKERKDTGKEHSREQGQRFLEKEIAVGPIPGREFDQCPEVMVRKNGKESYFLQTSECIMYVQKPKKGKDRSSVPVIMTERARQR